MLVKRFENPLEILQHKTLLFGDRCSGKTRTIKDVIYNSPVKFNFNVVCSNKSIAKILFREVRNRCEIFEINYTTFYSDFRNTHTFIDEFDISDERYWYLLERISISGGTWSVTTSKIDFDVLNLSNNFDTVYILESIRRNVL